MKASNQAQHFSDYEDGSDGGCACSVVLGILRVIDGFGMLPYCVHRSLHYESIVGTAAERDAQTEEFRSRTKPSESFVRV